MLDQPSDTNKNAIKVALAAALGSALGIITAIRTLSAGKPTADSRQPTADSGQPTAECLSPTQYSCRPEGTRSTQHSTGRPDWERLPAAHLPRPTYWPIVLALAIVFLAWGVVTTVAISVIGLALFALGLGGWIGELRHGHE
jgi:hypothetical protein